MSKTIKLTDLLSVIVVLSLIALGLGALLISSALDPKTIYAKAFDHVGAALLVVGVLGVYERWKLRREFLIDLRETFRLSKDCADSGLLNVAFEPGGIDYQKMLRTKGTLTIVLNDGRKWLSNQFIGLNYRLSRPGFTTEVMLVDPEGEYIKLLAMKTGDAPEKISEKIRHSINNLKEERSRLKGTGILKIYFIKHFPTYSAFVGDDEAVISMYTISNRRQSVPAFRIGEAVGEDTLLDFVKNDIKEARATAKIVFDSTAESATVQQP